MTRPPWKSRICSCPTRRPNPRANGDRVLPVAAVETETEKTSGFEADLGRLLIIDRFRVDGIPPPFLKRIRLEGSGDRDRWTLLVGEGTVFDLRIASLRRTESNSRPDPTVTFVSRGTMPEARGSRRRLALKRGKSRPPRCARR